VAPTTTTSAFSAAVVPRVKRSRKVVKSVRINISPSIGGLAFEEFGAAAELIDAVDAVLDADPADDFLGFSVLGEGDEAEDAKEDAAESVATADAGGVAAVGIIGHR
jgi:hypothetical protein